MSPIVGGGGFGKISVDSSSGWTARTPAMRYPS